MLRHCNKRKSRSERSFPTLITGQPSPFLVIRGRSTSRLQRQPLSPIRHKRRLPPAFLQQHFSFSFPCWFVDLCRILNGWLLRAVSVLLIVTELLPLGVQRIRVRRIAKLQGIDRLDMGQAELVVLFARQVYCENRAVESNS